MALKSARRGEELAGKTGKAISHPFARSNVLTYNKNAVLSVPYPESRVLPATNNSVICARSLSLSLSLLRKNIIYDVVNYNDSFRRAAEKRNVEINIERLNGTTEQPY